MSMDSLREILCSVRGSAGITIFSDTSGITSGFSIENENPIPIAKTTTAAITMIFFIWYDTNGG